MTTLKYTVTFQKSVLATVIGLCLSQSCFALQELTDDKLSDTTGEGIALLPENAAMIFRDANAPSDQTYLTDRSLDTGYIRYIPVGPMSATAPATAGKADLYLYGLAISKGDGNLNSRFSAIDPKITSWGTAANPWLFKVATESNVPNFGDTAVAANNCGTTPDNCKVTYLALEAPRYDLTKPLTSALGLDAYNLKLAFWADAFVRDPKKMEGASDQFNLNGAGRANRMRLQAIWDGFSVNGSQIQLFQTLGGASSTAINGYTKDSSYNNTLGLAGVLRFNSGDTRNLKGTLSTAGGSSIVTKDYVDDSGNKLGDANGAADVGWINRYSPAPTTASTSTPQGSTNCNLPGGSASFYCMWQVRSRTTRVNGYGNGTWTSPASLSSTGVLRFSTRESGAGQGLLDSPGIIGGAAPTFDQTEGLFLYGANINLVLGSIYQPLMVNKDATSNNLVLELARIPNKPDIYKKIYTDYDNTNSGYMGSTCSVYACGSNISVNNVATYQGVNATHSSISIGTTQYNNGLLTASKDEGAIGVSFGALPSAGQSISPQTQGVYFYELQNRERRRGDNNNWQYCVTGNAAGTCTSWTANKGSGLAFDANGAAWKASTGTSLYDPTNPQGGYIYTETTGGKQFIVPTTTAPLPGVLVSGSNWMPTSPNANLNTYQNTTNGQVLNSLGQSGMTNLGSAVIDGMLIQHMKITTKGL